MFLKKIFNLAAVSAVFALAVSCSSDNPVKEREKAVSKAFKKGTVKVGIASSWNDNITDAYDALLLAQDEINESGGICGADFKFVKVDDEASPAKGQKKAYELAADKEISAVIGHAYSDISVPASLIYQYHGMLMFNPISSAHTLTRQKNSMIFRNCLDDSDYGNRAADFCAEKGWSRILIFYVDVTVGESIANSLELACGNRNIVIAGRDSFSFTQEDSDYTNIFKRWKNNYVFDAVFVAGNMPQIKRIMTLLREAGIKQPVLGSDSFDDPRFAETFGPEENGKIFAVTIYDDSSTDEEFLKFKAAFEKRYGHSPDQEGLQWYDACINLASAMRMAGTPVPSKVAQTLRENEWHSAAGIYRFHDGDIVGRPLIVKGLKDGKMVKVSD